MLDASAAVFDALVKRLVQGDSMPRQLLANTPAAATEQRYEGIMHKLKQLRRNSGTLQAPPHHRALSTASNDEAELLIRGITRSAKLLAAEKLRKVAAHGRDTHGSIRKQQQQHN